MLYQTVIIIVMARRLKNARLDSLFFIRFHEKYSIYIYKLTSINQSMVA